MFCSLSTEPLKVHQKAQSSSHEASPGTVTCETHAVFVLEYDGYYFAPETVLVTSGTAQLTIGWPEASRAVKASDKSPITASSTVIGLCAMEAATG